jgi:sugar phosphate isomerase/epimerase
MSWTLFAMDTGFFNTLGSYQLEARCEILRELGFDGIYHTLWSEPAWQDVASLGAVAGRFGLDVAGVYVTADISQPPASPGNARAAALADVLDGVANVEVALLASAPRPGSELEDNAVAFVTGMLERPGRSQSKVVLYPHVGTWMADIRAGLRLFRRIGHPDLRLTFSAFHWYAAGLGTIEDLRADLSDVAGMLATATMAGSRLGPDEITSGQGATVEPLDDGELDNFAVLGAFRDAGYAGPIGVQGYSVGGDAYAKLARSLAAFRRMEQRLADHPGWARLRPDPLPQPSRS